MQGNSVFIYDNHEFYMCKQKEYLHFSLINNTLHEITMNLPEKNSNFSAFFHKKSARGSTMYFKS